MAGSRRLSALAYSKPSTVLPGWMDPDAAVAAGQLFAQSGPSTLVVDRREILTSTARVVGATLGELPLKGWMGLITLHVAFGRPVDGRGESTVGHFGRLLWGESNKKGDARVLGGKDTRRLVQALITLRRAELTIPGYDTVRGEASDGVSITGLLSNLHFDQAILTAFHGGHQLDRRAFGKLLGAKGPGTLAWQLNDTYVRALADADLQRFDWAKVHQLRGVALALWLVFTSARIPYRPLMENPAMESVEIELTEEHCRALGVTASTDAARRRTFNQAGHRVCIADSDFGGFEAHGGRGMRSFLRVIRKSRATENGTRHLPAGQLALPRAA